MKSYVLLFGLVVFHFQFLWSQEESYMPLKNPSYIGLSLDYGYILQHTPSLEEIGDAYPRGLSID